MKLKFGKILETEGIFTAFKNPNINISPGLSAEIHAHMFAENRPLLPLYLLVFTASTAVIKGLLRNLLRSILSSSAVDVLGLPEPWRLSIVPFCLHF
jgi:hypothetical protein